MLKYTIKTNKKYLPNHVGDRKLKIESSWNKKYLENLLKLMKKYKSFRKKWIRPRAKENGFRVKFREKQDIKKIYGIKEKTLKRMQIEIDKRGRMRGESIIMDLERKLDIRLFRCHLSRSIYDSKRIIKSGMILVNGIETRKVNRKIKEWDKIIVDRERIEAIKETMKVGQYWRCRTLWEFRNWWVWGGYKRRLKRIGEEIGLDIKNLTILQLDKKCRKEKINMLKDNWRL